MKKCLHCENPAQIHGLCEKCCPCCEENEVEKVIKKVQELITNEMLICRKENTPTSRLTSLYMKVTELKL